LLWPLGQWPRDGEIDFPENGLDDLTEVGGFMHRQDATVGSDQYAMPHYAVDLTAWHTFAIEWSPDYCAFVLDGVVIGSTDVRVPDTPMRWVLQTETNISATPPGTGVNGDIEIDWIKAYSYAP
jgi:beta-glucanase (GH16 family)